MAKVKVERIKNIPSDETARNRLRGSVQEAVDILLQIDALKEQYKDIVTVEKEDHMMDPKFFKELVKVRFADEYKSRKARKDIEEKAELIEELDILMGKAE